MCPPDVGEIEDLIREAKAYPHAIVYQTIGLLEDSYDFEGMMEAGKKTEEPCRFPQRAMSSLEAYGVNVSRLAAPVKKAFPILSFPSVQL